jgi:transaldolase
MPVNENRLLRLASLGQSVWMDFIRRSTITSGELRRYIDEDGLRGVTSNPTIFDKAIASGPEYQGPVRSLALEGKSVAELYQAITVEDVQLAADTFRPLYDRLDAGDGFVSLEVSPHLAYDTAGTVAEARHLWTLVNRPNVMIKVPATRAGLPAIRTLVSEGVNVNVTLLFGLERYAEVAEAYIEGLEQRAAQSRSLRVASVASFFLSRIDVLIDAELDELEDAGRVEAALAARLRGQIAIASARVAYDSYKVLFGSERFQALAAKGARSQRLLWASTSTKNPAYSDVRYVDALIGVDTINTVPLETLNAYRDHGDPAPRLDGRADEARSLLGELRRAGVDLDDATQRLENDGVQKFAAAYDHLIAIISGQREAALHDAAGARS